MGKTAAKRARVRPMHVIMLPMKPNWSSEIADQKELSAAAEMDDNPLALPFLSRLSRETAGCP